MITIDDALRRILAQVPVNGTERVELGSAAGRILAEDVASVGELPPWPASAMDGYAVRAADVPGRLHVVETVAAGAVPRFAVPAGGATRIMTGAPVPDGADAVVMVEDTDGEGDEVTVRVSARVGQHIRPRGSEIARGAVVLRAGTSLGAGAVGVAAAIGVPSLRVWMRPRVAILSTGDEIVETGFPLGPGQIWSSNSHALAALVTAAGAVPVTLGNVRDDPAAIGAAFREALRCDVLISTGGVSVGDFDHVKPVLAELGLAMDFWRVAMKPGKPLAFGTLGGKPVFGLPGNPVSCMVNFLEFVRPLLRTMQGDPRPFLPVVDAEMTAPWRRRPGRPELVRVGLSFRDGRIYASIAGGQGSAHLAGMASAHGLALMDADQTTLEGPVRVQVFDSSFWSGATADLGPMASSHPADDSC